MRISGGRTEDGIVVGNTYDKYGATNPVVRRIMRGFAGRLQNYVERAAPASIHEVGCGEGYWTLRWARRGVPCRGTDFSGRVIDHARANARGAGLDPEMFAVRSIYELSQRDDRATWSSAAKCWNTCRTRAPRWRGSRRWRTATWYSACRGSRCGGC